MTRLAHADYEAAMERRRQRTAALVEQAKRLFDAEMCQRGEPVPFGARNPAGQKRRVRSRGALVGARERATLCSCGCRGKVYARGLARSCYHRDYARTHRCACGCGRVANTRGYSRTCLRRMELDRTVAA